MSIKLSVVILTCLIILIGGCKNHVAELPDIGIPDKEINSRFRIEAPTGWNTFKIGEIIGLNIVVTSPDQVAFSQDYGAKIYRSEADRWIEVSNLMKYPDGSVMLSYSEDDPFMQGSLGLVPDLTQSEENVLLRII